MIAVLTVRDEAMRAALDDVGWSWYRLAQKVGTDRATVGRVLSGAQLPTSGFAASVITALTREGRQVAFTDLFAIEDNPTDGDPPDTTDPPGGS